MAQFTKEQIKAYLDKSYNDPSFFSEVVLGRGPYWSLQEQTCQSLVDNKITVVVSGNSTGKTHGLAGNALWFSATRKDSMVVTTASTANQLTLGLWANIRKSHFESRIPLGGKITGSPIEKLEYDSKWFCVGITSSNVEALSGFHARELLAIIDEASGVPDDAYEAIVSLNPSKLLVVGNPLRPSGWFYELARKAATPGSGLGYIHIPSTASPDIEFERSPRGLADKGFLRSARTLYGEGSLWWISHIDAQFPTTAEDALIPGEWLDAVAKVHTPGGTRKITIDYAEGSGGDKSVLCVSDQNGIYYLEGSNQWKADELARRTLSLSREYAVSASNITWDATGTGHGFGNSLRAVGLEGCKAYKGARGVPGNAPGERLRDMCGWKLRLRLDPSRVSGVGSESVVQVPFYISPAHLLKLRPEIQALSYTLSPSGKIKVLSKQQVKDRLGHSPDYLDSLLMRFYGS